LTTPIYFLNLIIAAEIEVALFINTNPSIHDRRGE